MRLRARNRSEPTGLPMHPLSIKKSKPERRQPSRWGISISTRGEPHGCQGLELVGHRRRLALSRPVRKKYLAVGLMIFSVVYYLSAAHCGSLFHQSFQQQASGRGQLRLGAHTWPPSVYRWRRTSTRPEAPCAKEELLLLLLIRSVACVIRFCFEYRAMSRKEA